MIGGGPVFDKLKTAFPKAHFLGPKYGRELARHLAGGDVFVFPSRTDTFGLVMLEAMACGLPVAAFPVQGPIGVIVHVQTGCLDENLEKAIERALTLERAECISYARGCSWEATTKTFAGYLDFNRPMRGTAVT